MHISEGILSAPVLVTGAALTAAAVGYSLKKMEHKEVPKVAILSSVFFRGFFNSRSRRSFKCTSNSKWNYRGIIGLVRLSGDISCSCLARCALSIWRNYHLGSKHF